MSSPAPAMPGWPRPSASFYGVVGIDMVAGPSEILVIADGNNDPDWIAADLLSQAEHDPTSQSILITDDAGFARQVEDCVDVQISQLSTGKTARTSWDAHGVIIVVNDLEAEAPALANRLAAEHVELAVDNPETLMHAIRHAGSIFLGRMTPEAVGDYVAGPNHVLPTGRRARFFQRAVGARLHEAHQLFWGSTTPPLPLSPLPPPPSPMPRGCPRMPNRSN